MTLEKLRRQLAAEAARLIRIGRETEIPRARMAAARSLVRSWVPPDGLPDDVEIRDELQRHQWMLDAEDRSELVSETEHDHFRHYRLLLSPLEQVLQSPESHPEGDALYHSLQVFALARVESPWDQEFLLAALLHDVGKGIDARDHVAAGLVALDGHVTERTAWLIENHPDAHRLHDGTLGARALRRLREHPDYDLLLTLGRCDRDGRVPGAVVPTLDEALAALQELAEMCGE
ncbi:MAG: hypothetical protein R3B90_13520 [Planctomycetaceae bacterium]